MPPRASPERIKEANARYHDAAAAEYDSKWAIDFGPIGQAQVRAKLAKALGTWPHAPFGRALEVGAGTGYFSLNLLQLGVIEGIVATDISTAMLGELAASAMRLGVQIETRVTDAERLPFEDETFDLVFGHAVLHHLPRLEMALAEFHRVLRAGGTIAFCGEPSRYGDLMASVPKRAGQLAAPLWRRLVGAPARPADPAARHDGHQLEPDVDVHAFTPGRLKKMLDEAGFDQVRIEGEELLGSAFGWTIRTLEGTADPSQVPDRWRGLAFRGYVALQRFDAMLLEPLLPASAFYNLVLSARAARSSRPGESPRSS